MGVTLNDCTLTRMMHICMGMGRRGGGGGHSDIRGVSLHALCYLVATETHVWYRHR